MRPRALAAAFAALSLPLCASGVVPSPAVAAAGRAPVQPVIATPSCGLDRIVGTEVPDVTAHRPGRYAVVKTTLRNATRSTYHGVTFSYKIYVPYERKKRKKWPPKPSVKWRVGSGKWHSLALARSYDSSDHSWSSGGGHDLGDFSSRTRKRFQIAVAYHKGDPAGLWDGTVTIQSLPDCDTAFIGFISGLAPYYEP